MTTARKQSFVAADGFEVLYDGSKTFWKTRSNLDILICSHLKQLCIEIISYNAEIGIEAPRIYVSSMLLSTKMNMDDFQEKIASKKEIMTRQKKAFSVPEVTKLIYNEMFCNYILSRLNICPDIDTKHELKITLVPNTSDTLNEEHELDIVIKMPPSLKPVVVCYHKNVSAEEVSLAQFKLKSEQIKLQNATKLAELAASSADAFKIMLEEKRRQALLMKVMSSARLRWIKSINRVLIQNYIENVKIRLLHSNVAEWYKKIADPDALTPRTKARVEAAKVKKLKDEKVKNKKLRNSLDNSALLPNVTTVATAGHSPEKTLITSESTNNTKLPSITSNKVPDKLTVKASKPISRRTFDANESNHSNTSKNPNTITAGRIFDPDAKPPSLRQSFTEMSGKVLIPLDISILHSQLSKLQVSSPINHTKVVDHTSDTTIRRSRM